MKRQQFSRDLLDELLSNPPLKDSEVPIIGGQSLFIWYLKYQDRVNAIGNPEEFHLAAESDDIDFLGPREVCRLVEGFITDILPGVRPDLSEMIEKIEPYYPSIDDPTPNSGMLSITLKDNDAPFIIDFLASMKGLKDKALQHTEKLHEEHVTYTILNPLQILTSRIANLYGLGYGKERYANEVIRVKLAALILAEYVRDALDNGAQKYAIKIIQNTYNLATTNDALRVFFEHGISITKHLPIDDERLGEDFREKNLLILKGKLQSKIEKYSNRLKSNAAANVTPLT